MVATAGIKASTDQPEKIDYKVVHEIVGRTRIRVPQLAIDPAYAAKLQQSVKSINSVTSVRINPLASSIVVQYRASASSNAIQEHLFACIQQAGVGESTEFTPLAPSTFQSATDEVVLAESSNSDASLGESTPEERVSQPESLPLTASAETITPDLAEVAIPDLLLTLDEAVSVTAITEEADLPQALPLTAEETVPAVMEESVNLPELQLDTFVAASPDSINEEQEIPDALPTTASTEVTAPDVKTDSSPVKLRLSQNDLAERLGVATQALTHQRTKPKFNEWSKARDPEGRAWIYASATKSYHTDDRKARKSQQSDAASDKNGKVG